MKITKYPQSNFLIENDGGKILTDPGNLTFEKYSTDDFGVPDAILITHQHPDHLDKEAVKHFVEKGVPMYGNHDVAFQFDQDPFEINKIEPEKEFEVAGFKVKPIDIPHCQMLFCTRGNEKITADTITPEKRCKFHPEAEPKTVDGPPNSGFIINDVFFHPGDGIEIKGLKVTNSAIPINGPTINIDRAYKLATSLGSKKVIPMHYSHPSFRTDPKQLSEKAKGAFEVVVLEDGASLEID